MFCLFLLVSLFFVTFFLSVQCTSLTFVRPCVSSYNKFTSENANCLRALTWPQPKMGVAPIPQHIWETMSSQGREKVLSDESHLERTGQTLDVLYNSTFRAKSLFETTLFAYSLYHGYGVSKAITTADR